MAHHFRVGQIRQMPGEHAPIPTFPRERGKEAESLATAADMTNLPPLAGEGAYGFRPGRVVTT